MTDIPRAAEVAVIGAGSVGIAVAYSLVRRHGVRDVVLVDALEPMSLTSAQSGENYRNWWPHPTMTAFTDASIDEMEAIDRESGGRLNMTRGGYALVTRRERPADLIRELERGYANSPGSIRLHESCATSYQPPLRGPWSAAPGGVDVLLERGLIRRHFPSWADDVATVIHVRRAGSISAPQLGQFMLERLRAGGARVLRARVRAIDGGAPFRLELETEEGVRQLQAGRIVDAAGPFVRDIAAMLGEDLPVRCVFQQKIAFEDRQGAVPRQMPFTIDLDPQTLAWSEEDRELLAGDPATRYLVEPLRGGVHCRPDGAPQGRWIKLGWACNDAATDPHGEPPLDPQFPDTVLRGASRLHPGLAANLGRLPRGARHYGGWYAMTDENWPLIGPLATPGAFVAGALSGFGSMAACAAGSLCAAWVQGERVPVWARALGLERHGDAALMAELVAAGRGSL
ncbi:MAG: FAD-binding oxidoreductase [Burkholderiales bacterium]|nr:FAD-binding oxidoreductase [Burkholderiales bacterium]MDE2397174.1 FAD-binding oxidoreductase [Burkholderiales bacterium]